MLNNGLFPIHPITVHLPIGLLIGNLLLSILILRSRDHSSAQELDISAYHCVRLGTLLLLPAIGAGILDAARYWFSPARQDHVLSLIHI